MSSEWLAGYNQGFEAGFAMNAREKEMFNLRNRASLLETHLVKCNVCLCDGCLTDGVLRSPFNSGQEQLTDRSSDLNASVSEPGQNAHGTQAPISFSEKAEDSRDPKDSANSVNTERLPGAFSPGPTHKLELESLQDDLKNNEEIIKKLKREVLDLKTRNDEFGKNSQTAIRMASTYAKQVEALHSIPRITLDRPNAVSPQTESEKTKGNECGTSCVDGDKLYSKIEDKPSEQDLTDLSGDQEITLPQGNENVRDIEETNSSMFNVAADVLKAKSPTKMLEVRPFKCDICGEKFLKAKYRNKHVMAFHSSPSTKDKKALAQKLECETCGKMLKNEKTLRNHVFIYHIRTSSQQKSCPICDQAIRKDHYIKHVLFCRKRLNGFQCPTCGIQLRNIKHLNKHVTSYHPETSDNAPKCPICDAALPVHELNNHILTCNPE